MKHEKFEVVPLNKKDHEKIDHAARWTREHFPWFVKLASIFVKKDV